jgi:hypothetical protein
MPFAAKDAGDGAVCACVCRRKQVVSVVILHEVGILGRNRIARGSNSVKRRGIKRDERFKLSLATKKGGSPT